MSYVKLSNISKAFDRVEVLKDINLEIKKDEFCVLVGPSGCGKSTLLRIIAGLENTSSGSLSINNNDVTELRPRDRNIAMVFQNYALYPHLTVRSNMEFGLKLDKTPKEQINRLVNEAAEILKMTEQQVANFKFDFLSRLRTLIKRQGLSQEVFPELYQD